MNLDLTTDAGVEILLRIAKHHGETSEPDHEVGDLQVFLRQMWQHMTPGQRTALLDDIHVRGTIAGALFVNIDDTEEFYKALVQADLLTDETVPPGG